MILGVLLPIPVFAATGLSIPLPAVVERIAAALVPWADEAPLEGQAFSLGENGSIVLAPGERPVTASEGPRASSSTEDQLRRQQAGERAEGGGSRSQGTDTGTAGGGGGAQDGSSAPSTTQGGGGGQSDDPGSSSSGDTGPVQDTVDDVVGATEPVVGTLEDAVEDIPGAGGVGGVVDDVGKAAGDTAAGVDGVLAGLGD